MFWTFGREWERNFCLLLFFQIISGPFRKLGTSLYERGLLPKPWTVANMINLIVELNQIWLLGSNAEMAGCSFFSNPHLPPSHSESITIPFTYSIWLRNTWCNSSCCLTLSQQNVNFRRWIMRQHYVPLLVNTSEVDLMETFETLTLQALFSSRPLLSLLKSCRQSEL